MKGPIYFALGHRKKASEWFKQKFGKLLHEHEGVRTENTYNTYLQK